MLAYRITQDKNEISQYKEKKIYFDNKPVFNTPYKNTLYELNTFPDKNGIHKHFYYFPQDAFELSKILLYLQLRQTNKKGTITILEYELDNNLIINKIGFGNYNCLKRKDYLPESKLIHISPYENSSYPVLEIRVNKDDSIKTTNNSFIIENDLSIPEKLNNLVKLKQFILYKTYLERILYDLNVNYPHGRDGLMMISKYNGNVKELTIPEKYRKFIC